MAEELVVVVVVVMFPLLTVTPALQEEILHKVEMLRLQKEPQGQIYQYLS
jgi:hypothetical protein